MAKIGPVEMLFLTDDLGGGTGNHLLPMLKYWDKNEWRMKVFSKRPAGVVMIPDVSIEVIPSLRRLNHLPFAQLNTLLWLYRRIGEHPVDLIHAFFFWPIIYGRILKLMGKTKTLIENREDMGFSWGKHEYAWLKATRTIPDRVICVSEAVREVVLEREKLDERRVVVIRNGINRPKQSNSDNSVRRELGWSEEHLVVGMVANYNRPVKGATYLLDAIPSIVSQVPSARFLLVGGGDGEESSLEEKTKALGIEQFVAIAGFQEDIHKYYRAMDLSVLTSLSEGLSITLLESMSYSIPVVATRVGGNLEVVDEGKTGYLVPLKDPCALANRVVWLLQNPELRLKMGEEGRRRVESQFRMQDVADRYMELYSSVIFG